MPTRKSQLTKQFLDMVKLWDDYPQAIRTLLDYIPENQIEEVLKAYGYKHCKECNELFDAWNDKEKCEICEDLA